jgi:predicted transcriptional regulator
MSILEHFKPNLQIDLNFSIKDLFIPNFCCTFAVAKVFTMEDNFAIQLFEGKKVRIVWDEEQEKYYFAVADIVQVLTDSADVKQYIKKLRARDSELDSVWGTICTPHQFVSTDAKKHAVNCADLQGIFRIIQSIPSKKAEPVKQWLAQLGEQRIDQMIDPELTFQMAVEDYRRQGYSDKWINERMRSIEMRKELTDEWQRAGITEHKDFAILTNVLTQAWSGMTTGEYKRHKGLTKENLRDNMTNVELALNTLAEVATTELSRQRNPKGMVESKQAAQAGGKVAKNAREDLERQLGRSVISSERASDYLRPIEEGKAQELPFDEDKDK